ncbi:MAG: NADPH-dependent F420 reductase [Candidatus Heimdallarchaeota archaeon]
MQKETISLIGGTGQQGPGIAARLALGGINVIIGSRQDEKAKRVANELREKLNVDNITGVINAEAVKSADVVFLTIPYDYVEATLKKLEPAFREDAILVDTTNPLTREGKHFVLAELPERKSGSEIIQQFVPPKVTVVAAYKTIGFDLLMQVDQQIKCDVLICGDNSTAKERVIRIIKQAPNMGGVVDLGPLLNARFVEGLVPLAVNVNRARGVKSTCVKFFIG